MKRIILMLAGLVWGSLTSHAAVTFTAGSADVAPGNFSVPIIVGSDLAAPSDYWGNAGFNLVWDPNILTLQLTPVNIAGSPITELSTGINGNFESPFAGQLNFSWVGGGAYQVPNGSTLFTVNFTAIGDVGESTEINFTSIATIGLTDSVGGNDSSVIPTGIGGSIQVVPEPVASALGVFAMIVLGTAGVRWYSRRRKALHC